MALHPCAVSGCPALVAAGIPRCQDHQTGRERDREHVEARRGYRTARWRRLIQQVRQEQPLCAECSAEGRVSAWDALDHIVPHRGNADLFWDRTNLQGLCTAHHNRKSARGE